MFAHTTTQDYKTHTNTQQQHNNTPSPPLKKQLFWKDPGAPSYLVTAYDAYSGRALGVSYRTQGGWISVPGLPVGSPVLLSVQGSSKDGAALSEPATVTVEIPAPQTPVYQGGGGYYGGGYYGGGYYDSYYSPYAVSLRVGPCCWQSCCR